MKKTTLFIAMLFALIVFRSESCDNNTAVSASGAKKANTQVTLDLNGNTVEQNNIIARLKQDNLPGSIKHLYLISPLTGDVLLYSTVKGKVTSGGKRLSPSKSEPTNSTGNFQVPLGNGEYYYTNETLDDNGTYGSSSEYIYWWDSKGVYQQCMPGNAIVMVSSQPMVIKKAIINLENPNAQ